MMSWCHGSMYTVIDPGLLMSLWLASVVALSKNESNGGKPPRIPFLMSYLVNAASQIDRGT